MDPPLQLEADEKVEENEEQSREQCRGVLGKVRRHLLVLCVLSDASGGQRSSVLQQHTSDALHEPFREREEWEADVWVAAALWEETPVALSPFLWSHHWLASCGAHPSSTNCGWTWFWRPAADYGARDCRAAPVFTSQRGVPLGAAVAVWVLAHLLLSGRCSGGTQPWILKLLLHNTAHSSSRYCLLPRLAGAAVGHRNRTRSQGHLLVQRLYGPVFGVMSPGGHMCCVTPLSSLIQLQPGIQTVDEPPAVGSKVLLDLLFEDLHRVLKELCHGLDHLNQGHLIVAAAVLISFL